MNKTVIAVVVALVVGGGAGYVMGAGSVPEASTAAHPMSMDSMMVSMNAELEGKTGDRV